MRFLASHKVCKKTVGNGTDLAGNGMGTSPLTHFIFNVTGTVIMVHKDHRR
jgi:hypothetical protein